MSGAGVLILYCFDVLGTHCLAIGIPTLLFKPVPGLPVNKLSRKVLLDFSFLYAHLNVLETLYLSRQRFWTVTVLSDFMYAKLVS